MLLFLLQPPPTTPPVTRNRKEVSAIVMRAPTGKRSLAWWQRWLADHWQ